MMYIVMFGQKVTTIEVGGKQVPVSELQQMLSWHVGEDPPPFDPRDVLEIQADEDELLWVLRTFINLPCSSQNVQHWYGDLAKLIASGIPQLD